MKYYISEIIPRIQQFSKRLDENALFTSNEWVQFNQDSLNRIYYIFRKNGELLVTEKGIGKKIKWENLGNGRITIEEESTFYHFRIAFYDGLFLVMNLNDTNNYVFFLNETKLGVDFKTIGQINSYLSNRYSINSEESSNDVNNLENITYEEDLPLKNWDIILGNYTSMYIRFSDGLKGNICKGAQSGKYYYFHNSKGVIYCDSKKDCICQLHKHLKSLI